MADFKVIETQEQLDSIIVERLRRQAESMEKKYSDYFSPDDVAQKTEGLSAQIAELQKTLEEERAKAGTYDSQIETLTKQIKTYESESVKNRISAEYGLPYELSQRLAGETEEEIRADAENLKKIFGRVSTNTVPLATSEESTNGSNADMKAMLRQLKGE